MAYFQPDSRTPSPHEASAEREHECLYAGIEKMDLECAIDDWFRLSDQLVQPLFDDRAIAALVNVQAAGRAWRLPVDRHTKPYLGILVAAAP